MNTLTLFYLQHETPLAFSISLCQKCPTFTIILFFFQKNKNRRAYANLSVTTIQRVNKRLEANSIRDLAVEETPKVRTELRSECFRLTSKFQQPVTATECMLTERQISENIFGSGSAWLPFV